MVTVHKRFKTITRIPAAQPQPRPSVLRRATSGPSGLCRWQRRVYGAHVCYPRTSARPLRRRSTLTSIIMLSMTSAVARHCISPRCWCAPTAGLVQLVARRPHSVDGTECGRPESGCTRPAVGAYQHRSACSAHGTIRLALQLLAEWYQSLARAPPVESCAQLATVIESYLYPFRTGRVAAQIGHTRAHGDRTVKMKIPVSFPLGTSQYALHHK